MSKDFTTTTELPPLALAENFGDPETLFNSRGWLQKALESRGAKIIGAGCGCGEADLDIVIEGCKFNVSIRPIILVPEVREEKDPIMASEENSA